jgi:hypothetical protein
VEGGQLERGRVHLCVGGGGSMGAGYLGVDIIQLGDESFSSCKEPISAGRRQRHFNSITDNSKKQFSQSSTEAGPT